MRFTKVAAREEFVMTKRHPKSLAMTLNATILSSRLWLALILLAGLASFCHPVCAAQRETSKDSIARAEMPAARGSASAPEQVKKEEIDPTAYIIGEQDSLVITVWKEKELSGGAIVRPDGKITVPLVGEIKVVGMTPVQVQKLLTEKLKPFVTVPQVTVAVN